MLVIRLVTSPPLPAGTFDDVRRRLVAAGTLLGCLNDLDLNVSVVSFRADDSDATSMLSAICEKIGAPGSVGRAFRIDVQTGSGVTLSDEAVRSMAVAVHGTLRAPVYIARRTLPAAAWKSARAMGWSRDGLGPPNNAPVLPYSGSESRGIAIEIGPPLFLFKVQLAGVTEAQAEKILSAVGGPESGFAEVGTYLVAAQRNDRNFCVLELSDLKRTPPARVLRVLGIEARRYGGELGAGAVLSHLPLQSLLDTLAAHTGLQATSAQVIETHLGASGPGQS